MTNNLKCCFPDVFQREQKNAFLNPDRNFHELGFANYHKSLKYKLNKQ